MLLSDVDGISRCARYRQRCFRDRWVSIPPYLRPIEEEPNNEDHPLPGSLLSTDHCSNSLTTCRVITSATGNRDVTTPVLTSERLQNHDVIDREDEASRDDYDVTKSSSRKCSLQPIIERCACENGGGCEKCLADSTGLPIKSASNRPIGEDDKNDVTAGESPQTSKQQQQWRLFYVTVASLTAFVACLSSMSPSGFIFVVTVMSLIAHHVIQS